MSQQQPTREEVEAACDRIEKDTASFGKIRQDAFIVAAALRALIASQPRVWTAETIKDAPDDGDDYRGFGIMGWEWELLSWGEAREKLESGDLSYVAGPFAMPPIPQPDTTTNQEKP